jgi:hypothetical protein
VIVVSLLTAAAGCGDDLSSGPGAAGHGGVGGLGTGGNVAGSGGHATAGGGGGGVAGTGGIATAGTGGHAPTGIGGGVAGHGPGGSAGAPVGGAGGSAPVSCLPHCDVCGSVGVCTACAAGYALTGGACGPLGAGTSCRTLHLSNPSLPNGAYALDPDGSGPGAPFTAYCDMTADGGGWMKILQYTNSPYTPTADAVGDIAVAGIPAMAKLSDANVNKLGGLAIQREYRIKGDTSTKKLFMKSTAVWNDPARAHGLILTGTGFACEDVTSCAYARVTAPEGRATIDSNDWRPSSIGDKNDQDRYFTDYTAGSSCYATGSLTQRCYGTGMSLGHALIPNLVIWTRELPFDNEAIAVYRLDEGSGDVIGDSSGKGHPATAIAGSWITAGHTGAAYQGAFRTNAALPTYDAITVSAWVRRDGAGLGSPRIVSAMYDELEVLDVEHTGTLGISLPGVGLQPSSVTSFGTGFHHVAVTVGLGTLTLYYDGAVVYTVATTIGLSGPLTFGARNNNAEAWVGAIDQVRVFDRALTAAEIARLAAE